MPADDFVGVPGRFWFRGEYIHWWTTGGNLPPMVSTVTNLADYLAVHSAFRPYSAIARLATATTTVTA